MADLRQMVRRHSKFTTAVGLLLLLSLIMYSYLRVMLVFWSAVAGVIFCYYSFSTDSLVPNVLLTHVRKRKKPEKDDELTLLKKRCPVCGKENCARHRPELNIVALQPWTNLKIPEKVDAAVEEFLNLVLKEYVYTWYRDLSEDEAFVDELRTSLRFIAAVLLRRAQKVDIPTLVTNKILKSAVRHLHHYLAIKRTAKGNSDLQQHMLEYYGPHVHCAMRSRQAELDYLKGIIEKIFPHILPLQSLKCKSLCVLLREVLAGAILLPVLDIIADPDIVNNLLRIFLDDTPPPECHDPPSPQVTILTNFSHPLCKNNSSLRVELSDILGNQDALFPFMQFMKSEASVNVLQFYLTVEEFNTKILTPELSDNQLLHLHEELTDLYNMYCDPAAVDRIQFDDDIVRQLREIVAGPESGVIKLQTSTPLFRAYEHAYNLLENTFLPLFHQSDDYYRMLCGERLPTKLARSLSRSGKRAGDSMSLSRLGSKIKGVFRSNTGLIMALAELRKMVSFTDGVDLPDTCPIQKPAIDMTSVSETPDPELCEGQIQDEPMFYLEPDADDRELGLQTGLDFQSEQANLPNHATHVKSKQQKRAWSLDLGLDRGAVLEPKATTIKGLQKGYSEQITESDAATPSLNMVEGRVLEDLEASTGEEAETVMTGGDLATLDNMEMMFRMRGPMIDDGPLRDLSAWRVTIPSIEPRPEPDNPKKLYHTFVIEVRRVDVLENDFEASNWRVDRRYNEFYVLEQKLTEFHGEFLDCQLPPKKAFGTKSKEFLEIRKAGFEEYLQKLLTKPNLRNSELLYNFLASFNEFTTSFLPDISLGKIVKSGAMKLVKERGQHLDPFLQSFVVSTEASKPKPCKSFDADSDTLSISSEKMANSLFDNNASIDIYISPDSCELEGSSDVDGVYDMILYLAQNVYEVPRWLWEALLMARILVKNSLENFLDWYIGHKLDQVSREHRVIKIIHLLRDVLFFDTDPPRTDEDKRRRRDVTLQELKNFIPEVFIGEERHKKGTELIFELLQQPKLNKQLSYTLLDDLLEELFPELLQSKDQEAFQTVHRQ